MKITSALSRKNVSSFLLFIFSSVLFSGCTEENLRFTPGYSQTISGKFVGFSSSAISSENQSNKLFSTDLGGFSCASPKVSLYELDNNGDKKEPALGTADIRSDGSYTFVIKTMGLKFKKTPDKPLIAVINGCSSGVYLRPITSTQNQDITLGSTLLTYLINTDKKNEFSSALVDKPEKIDQLLYSLQGVTTVDIAFDKLKTDPATKQLYVSLFDAQPEALEEASPEVVSLTLPDILSEGVNTELAVTASQWSQDYTPAYEWKLGSTVISTGASFTLKLNGNSQGNKLVTLRIGTSDGLGGINASKPIKTVTKAINVNNNLLPGAPDFSVVSPVVTGTMPINARSLTLRLETGLSQINCDTFSGLLLTENTSAAPQASSDFAVTCTQAPTQDISYNLVSSGDGAKVLRLWAKDASGVIAQVAKEFTVYLDTGVPTLSIATNPLAMTSQTVQNFVFVAQDNGGIISGYECKLDSGSWQSCTSPQSYTGLSEGTHTFSARAMDTAGNISNVDTKSWHIDTTPPSVVLASTPNLITNSLTAIFNLTVNDAGGSGFDRVECKMDSGAWSVCTPSVNSYTLTAGVHTFSARAYDHVGHLSSLQSYTWTIDTQGPTVTITSKPASLTNRQEAIFSFNGSDIGGGSVASYECSLDGATYASCVSGVTYNSLTAGNHSFNVRALDTAGNTGVAANYTWVIDLITPMATITSNPLSITSQTSASFAFTATNPPDGTIDGYECKLNAGSWGSCASIKTYSGLTQGDYEFKLKAVANNGYESSESSYSWKIDTTVPVLTVASAPSAITSQTVASFDFNATDTGGGSVAGYECKLDGGSYAPCGSPYNLSSLLSGTHTVKIKAVDTAGNKSLEYTHTWTIDRTAATLTLSSKPAVITSQTVASFVFNATDGGGGSVDHYSCKINTGAWDENCISPKSYSGLMEGVQDFIITVTDSVGNISSQTTYTWTIDRTGPTLSLTSTPSSLTNVTSATFVFSALDTGGAGIDRYECKLDGGVYSTCSSPKNYTGLTSNTSHTVMIRAIDAVGNISNISTHSWEIDTNAPTLTITTPSSNGEVVLTSQLSSYNLAGTCSENGRNVVLAGSLNATVPCSSNTWGTNVDLTALADGVLSVTASQTDLAGNSGTSAARNFIKDTVSPVINITTPVALRGNSTSGTVTWSLTEANAKAGTSFTVQIYDGSTWSNVGTVVATAGVNTNQAYTLSNFSVPNVDVTTAKIKVIFSDASGNNVSPESGSFMIDSSPPVVTSLSLNSGASTTSTNSIAVSFNAASASGEAKITHLCLRYNNNQAPLPSDPCWISLSRNDINITPATSISVSNFYFSVGLSPISYTIFAWVKDEVQHIVSNSSSITLQPGTPPTIKNIFVSNKDNPALPLVSEDLTFALNTDVYIYWNVSDVEGLAANALKLEYTLDDITWTSIASGLSETSQTNCTLIAGTNGCYKWASGAPTDNGTGTGTTSDDKSFKIRVVATDTSSLSAAGTSLDVNTGKLFLIAGNTNTGLNGSAAAAIFNVDSAMNNPSNAIFVITSKGELFFLDYLKGLLYVSPTDGLQKLLIEKNNTFGTEEGSILNTKLKLPYKIAMDYEDNVYIFDYDRIRKINTKSNPMTISTVIGGASATNNGMTPVIANDFKITPTTFSDAKAYLVFHVLGNGDIWFTSENYMGSQFVYRKRFRHYNKSDGLVYSYNIGGSGNSANAALDLTDTTTVLSKIALAYDTNTLNISKIIATSYTNVGAGVNWGMTNIDKETWLSQSPHPTLTGNASLDYYYTGLDGNIYSISLFQSYIRKYNFSTNTFSIVYGTSTVGYCKDGISATACNATISGIFVDKQGKLFVTDNNVIRTIDELGKVQTLFGQTLSYGENTLATNARFKEVSSAGIWYDTASATTKVIATDRFGYKLREFSPGGNIKTIAGTGEASADPTLGVSATATHLATNGSNYSSTSNMNMIVDPVNGDVYKGIGSNNNYILQRGSPDKWQKMIATGAGPFTNFDNDSLIGNPLAAGNVTWGSYAVTLFQGISSGSILMIDHDYDSSAIQHRGGAILEYNRANITLEKIAGKYGQPHTTMNLCSDGTLPTSCLSLHSLETSGANGYTRAHYDEYLDAWIMAVYGTTSVRILKKGSNMTTLTTVLQPIRSLAYLRIGGASPSKHNLWYCTTAGRLREKNLLNNQDVELDWKISNMICSSNYLSYSPERNSLIFPIKQNNLGGVAEYKLD